MATSARPGDAAARASVPAPVSLAPVIPGNTRLPLMGACSFALSRAVQRAAPPPAPVVTHITLIQNWFEEPKAEVPTGR